MAVVYESFQKTLDDCGYAQPLLLSVGLGLQIQIFVDSNFHTNTILYNYSTKFVHFSQFSKFSIKKLLSGSRWQGQSSQQSMQFCAISALLVLASQQSMQCNDKAAEKNCTKLQKLLSGPRWQDRPLNNLCNSMQYQPCLSLPLNNLCNSMQWNKNLDKKLQKFLQFLEKNCPPIAVIPKLFANFAADWCGLAPPPS